MTQTAHAARSGWQQDEIDRLWQEIQNANQVGAPLRDVFDRMGKELGRKPNSVRNYYYMQLRGTDAEELRRAAPFETFTPEEIHDLLRRVLMARGQGKSVRSCVQALSGGDQALMLRYQNKYRSILRKKPALIQQVCRELEQEGLPCPKDAPVIQASSLPETQDADVAAILAAAQNLARRSRLQTQQENDRMRVQKDLLLMRLEDLQLSCKALIALCKDFLAEPEDMQREHFPLFGAQLSQQIAKTESLCG